MTFDDYCKVKKITGNYLALREVYEEGLRHAALLCLQHGWVQASELINKEANSSATKIRVPVDIKK